MTGYRWPDPRSSRARVLAALSDRPVGYDALTGATGHSMSAIRRALLFLERKGLAQRRRIDQKWPRGQDKRRVPRVEWRRS